MSTEGLRGLVIVSAWTRGATLVTTTLMTTLFAGTAYAQVGGTYDLRWNTIDGGGVTFSTGGAYSVGATSGQHDAGTSSGGSYILRSGFWKGGVSTGTTSVPVSPGTPAAPTPPDLPVVYRLHPNYPNPFNPRTTIAYDLPHAGEVDLSVYDVNGTLVRALVRGQQNAGRYWVVWEGADNAGREVAGGVYFTRLHAGSFVDTRKIVMVK